ncbi:MAG: HD domain-containing protein, partial [Legionella sp.]
INAIANRKWLGPRGKPEPLLTETEKQHLQIQRGTLSQEERQIINNHVSVTIKMLESLPYPKGLKNVPLLAGCHHEKINGTGYPRGLTKDQMPMQARMIAIADVFEALTAEDRPYKKSMPLSQTLTILGKMKVDGHIDPDLFDVFMDAKIYLKYGEKHLKKDTLDLVDLNKIPGYHPL